MGAVQVPCFEVGLAAAERRLYSSEMAHGGKVIGSVQELGHTYLPPSPVSCCYGVGKLVCNYSRANRRVYHVRPPFCTFPFRLYFMSRTMFLNAVRNRSASIWPANFIALLP